MAASKKILVLFGSPHGAGYTRQLLDSFLAPFLEQGWQVGTVDAYAAKIKPCTGCGACGKKEGCAFPDFDPIDRAIRESDFLVVASPVYNDSFPAPLKAILDRTQRYFEARFSLNRRPPIKKHRDAALLLTMGAEEEFPIEVTVHQLRRAFSVMNTALVGCAVWPGTNLGDGRRRESMEKASALALDILSKM